MVIMVIEISDFLSRIEASQYTIFTQKFHSSVAKTLNSYRGVIKSKDNNNYHVMFSSVNDAVQCALEVRHKFKYVTPKHGSFNRRLKIGMSVSDQYHDQAVVLASRICENVKDKITMSWGVKDLYERSSQNSRIDESLIRVLNRAEELFLTQVMDLLEHHWKDPDFDVEAFCKALGFNYSQVYWRLGRLTGKTPNNFIKEFRLHQAAILLHERQGSIAKISREVGFNSPNYFSECFLDKYGIRPSKYLQQHT